MVMSDTCESIECDPDEVMVMLREQAALYGRLEAFAGKQRALVTQEDTAPLLSLLGSRQRLSVDLQRLATRLEPVRRAWGRFRERFTPDQRREADALLTDIRVRLKRVMERDAEDARVLSGRKQSISGALNATRAAGQAMSAYRASGPPRSLDRLDEAS